MDRPLTIVIPVYNEGANFPALWSEMTEHLNFPFTAFVAYDFDGDNTVPVAQQVIDQGETRLKLIKNSYGRGVVGAIRTGFDAAAPGPVLVLMADLSDDLGQVSKMLEHYRRGSHIVVGSRYMKGGRLMGAHGSSSFFPVCPASPCAGSVGYPPMTRPTHSRFMTAPC